MERHVCVRVCVWGGLPMHFCTSTDMLFSCCHPTDGLFLHRHTHRSDCNKRARAQQVVSACWSICFPNEKMKLHHWSCVYLQSSTNPERVASVHRLIWSSLESRTLSGNAPSSQLRKLIWSQGFVQFVHEYQCSNCTECGTTWKSDEFEMSKSHKEQKAKHSDFLSSFSPWASSSGPCPKAPSYVCKKGIRVVVNKIHWRKSLWRKHSNINLSPASETTHDVNVSESPLTRLFLMNSITLILSIPLQSSRM